MGKQKEMSTKVHFKMYKTGRTWAIAGIGILSLALGTASTTQNINAAAVDSNVPVSKVADSAVGKPVKTTEATATVASTKENKTSAPTVDSKAKAKVAPTTKPKIEDKIAPTATKMEDKKVSTKTAEPKTEIKTTSDKVEDDQDSTDEDYVDHSKVSLTNVWYTAKQGQALNVRELFKGATDVDGSDVDYSKITVQVDNPDGTTVNKSVGSDYSIDTSKITIDAFTIYYSFTNSEGAEVSNYVYVLVSSDSGASFSFHEIGSIYENQEFSPEQYFVGATKSNNEDVPFSKITVDTSKLDTTTPGSYTVVYSFVDSDNSIIDNELHVTVLKDQSKLNVKNITLKKGETFSSEDYNKLVSAVDSDGSTGMVGPDSENVNTNKPGVYKVTFEFYTLSGKVLTGTSVVTVKDTNTGSGTNNGTGNTNTGSGTNNGTGNTNTGSGTNNGTGNINTGSGTNNGTGNTNTGANNGTGNTNTGSGTNNGTGNTNKENTLSNGTGNTNNGTSNANKENTLSTGTTNTGTKVLAPMAESGNANNKLNSETLPQTGEASESNVTIMGAVLLVLSSFIGIFTFSNKNQKN
ncbi:KxYKxGKxW signal peptide domain-containing protein [Dellaglioa algida]|uniref:KxYKxGKxW signal peptide domain-containing protein n=1 Tax=Dellaglioa algida TaxID=105612 RepID=UPI000BD0AEEF|nr:KxYKxGKxW signal peptide domain-containing protein [Dellaglioa algida]MDK1718430.1 KxYKxGKxW signal peptide domain-containing protein [Dellaglioa algida]MDK1728816.1 KxYKxGKxW signal peptide domain-containing protein [Dellaglioa algida]MDK1729478.1 KxYKxGKxW signal peptide domain-containing protein [Dellaglioa algida]MDK1736493.1 KxYKxGKxW signal peptide domain-containing protein [Dellaglioa algida]MDK1737547.1 KxYKxGKxW signal peptide domain-containing protein [Dellaglioa algida]